MTLVADYSSDASLASEANDDDPEIPGVRPDQSGLSVILMHLIRVKRYISNAFQLLTVQTARKILRTATLLAAPLKGQSGVLDQALQTLDSAKRPSFHHTVWQGISSAPKKTHGCSEDSVVKRRKLAEERLRNNDDEASGMPLDIPCVRC